MSGQRFERLSIRAVVMAAAMFWTGAAAAGTVSFKVDPNDFDDDMNGAIEGTEFTTTGSDGVVFAFTPTLNLVGGARMFLSVSNGLRYGGGGGSSLTFDFVVGQDIFLERYTLSDTGFFANDSFFDIRQGAATLSNDNLSDAANQGNTLSFFSGPILLEGGVTYSFVVNSPGAGVQGFMDNWEYSIPAPAGIALVALALAGIARRR